MITIIPNLHVSTNSKAQGSALVFIQSRKDATPIHTGEFQIKIDVAFDTATNDYPVLTTLALSTKLSDSLVATFTATSIELINSFGKHTPTIYLTGRCSVQIGEHAETPKGCKYWLMIANNKNNTDVGTPDIVGFAIIDNLGNRVAYATGPVKSGDIFVSPA